MKKNLYIFVIILFFLSLFCFVVCFEIKKTRNYREEYKNHTINTFKNLKFKGDVVSLKECDFGGRTYGIMAVKLDYCNVDSFYVFDNMSCLKISKGIAILPTNCIHPNDTFDKRSNALLNSIYVMVNTINGNQIIYVDSSGNHFSENLDFPSKPFNKDLFDQISLELVRQNTVQSPPSAAVSANLRPCESIIPPLRQKRVEP